MNQSKFLRFVSLLGSFTTVLTCRPPIQNTSKLLTWTVENYEWTRDVEHSFSNWIEQLGMARADGKCVILSDCLRNPEANSLYEPDVDNQLNIYADCADAPMILRSYFAYKKKLPFSMAKISGSRYTPGNVPTGLEVQQSSYADRNIAGLFRDIVNTIQSGYFRTAADTEGTDTFPASISTESIRPGTLFYDPNGHVLIVYKVDKEGTIRLMDGHPDNSLTVQRFGEKFAYGNSANGGGFRNWRLTRWENGKVTRLSNAEHSGYYGGDSQYSSQDNWGGTGDYYKWVRKVLSNGSKVVIKYEFEDRLGQLCVDLKDRANSVSVAIDKGIHNKRIEDIGWPRNIFSSDGEWENFSTPSRDARLRSSIREIHAMIQNSYDNFGSVESQYDFSGIESQFELIQFYRDSWDAAAARSECQINYQSSSDANVTLNLNTISDVLFDMSFDPYHCVELRWGAKPGTCGYNQSVCGVNDKQKWYEDEAGWRNRIDRNYDERTDIGGGDISVPKIHIPAILEKLQIRAQHNNDPYVLQDIDMVPKWCRTLPGAKVHTGPGKRNEIALIIEREKLVKVTQTIAEKWYSVEFEEGCDRYGESIAKPAWIRRSMLDCE